MLVRVIILWTALVLLSGPRPSWSATLRVPEEFGTIEEALEKAAAGDVISVAAGSYPENLVVTKAVRLVSRRAHEAEIVGQERKEPVLKFDSVEGTPSIESFKINGNFRSTAGIEVVESNPRILDNELVFTSIGVIFRRSGGEVAGNAFHDNLGGEIRIMGSSPRIVRNRFDSTTNTAIQIIGKNSVPIIGGSPGEGNEFGPGYESEVVNESKNDIDARYNQWSWSSTVEMDNQPYPSNITAIYDGFDVVAKGKVNYGDWVLAEATGRSRLPLVVILIAVAVCVVAVGFLLVRRAKGGFSPSG